MQAVILTVSDHWMRRGVERFLPPEHHIRASRPVLEQSVTELIVEGPTLPAVVDGEYQRTDLRITAIPNAEDGTVRLEVYWAFEKRVAGWFYSKPWVLGVWPHAEWLELISS